MEAPTPDRDNYSSDGIEAILAERGATHGAFTDHARTTQHLKQVIGEELIARRQRGQSELHDVAYEALSMIAHKIGRILAGRWDHPDHWDDIAGYAKLVSNHVSQAQALPTPSTKNPSVSAPIRVGWEEPDCHDDPGDMTNS